MSGNWPYDDAGEHDPRRGLIDKLLGWIPGFRGYASAAERRASDERSRAFLADRLDQCKQALDRLARQWVDAGHLSELARLDALRGRIDLLLARLRSGPLAGQRFLDAARLDETQLQDALDHDVQIVEQTESLTKLIPMQASASPAEHAQQLEQSLDKLQKTVNRRAELLSDGS